MLDLCPICYHINLLLPGETPEDTILRLGADLYNLSGVVNLERFDREVERGQFAAATSAAADSAAAVLKTVEDQRKDLDTAREDLMVEQAKVAKDQVRILVLETEIIKLGGIVPKDTGI